MKPTTARARKYAAARGLPFLTLEDGFLRSCGLGVQGAQPLSLVVDDIGIYYDATRSARLECLIESISLDQSLRNQAERALDLIRRHKLSKYNHAPELLLPPLSAGAQGRVLVADQTAGDVSVSLGGADASTFADMLSAAIADNPDAEIWIKTHPDVLAGKKHGYLTAAAAPLQVRLLAEDVSPLALINQFDKVYVVTSQMGFEALMLNKPVICFGRPWYAGWGLTDDRHPGMIELRSRRQARRTLEELFAAAYLQYPRYIEPTTGKPGTIFDVIDWLTINKAANDATRGHLYCVGMSLWKRAVVRPFLTCPSNSVHFVRSVSDARIRERGKEARIVIWGTQDEARGRAVATSLGIPLWRMEDGFLRSVGLGSDLHRPVSLVLDKGGMYFNPASESDLESQLLTQQLNDEDLARAARLRVAVVKLKVSKYNLGRSGLEIDARGRRVILVPGQVEDDASIRQGAPVIQSNAQLLEAVRAANPDAYLVFKPHPDVIAGNRRGMAPSDLVARLADLCVEDVNIIDCIEACDEVHTLTSLSGFEALLRRKIVHCYGGPFYAGWGLTVDHLPFSRRRRQVTLDELVFATLVSYPRYALPGVPGFVSAEQVVEEIVRQSARSSILLRKTGLLGWLDRKVRKMKAISALLEHEWRWR